ncbi:MAG: hypothetical protein U0169_00770 [Polyangiaceae bacterium]
MTSRLPRSFAPPFVLILATIVVVVGSGPACSRKPSSTSEGSPAASVSGHTEIPVSQRSTATDAAARVVFDPLVTPAECTLGHRGVLLDLGTASGDRHVSSRARAADMKSVERDGATFARVASRSASFTVFATSEDVVGDPGAERPAKDGLAVSLRIRAGTAKSVVVVLNGKTLGTAVLPKDETAVVSVRSATASLAGGANDVTLQFRGAPTKGDPGVVADVD